MPSMYEIYQNHSYEYDELVRNEDYQNHLPETLHSLFDFRNKSVIELGTGTGRLTSMYIDKARQAYCYDRSPHMLSQAAVNLDQFKDKILFETCDNNAINQIRLRADFVIEGWSFGHTVSDYPEDRQKKINELVSHSTSLLNPGGKLIILETLGTNTEKADAPADFLNQFYSELEENHGFTRVVIETDYHFSSIEEAARIMGFFFGSEMSESIRNKGSNVVSEYTGLWYKK